MLFFVPGFFSRALLVRLGISIALAAASCFIIYSVFDKTFEYVKAAVQYEPYTHAKNLYDEKRVADADEFLSFYEGIPNVEITDAMRTLHDDIRATRTSISYQAQETARGLVLGESDEAAGQTVALVSEFTGVGDLRDLGKEGKKYFQGEEVDRMTVSLATIGLGMSALSFWGPQAAAAAPAKMVLSLFKRAAKALKASMRKNIDEIAGIAGKIVKARIDTITVKSSSFLDSMKKLDFAGANKAWNDAPPIDPKAVLKNADEVQTLDAAFSTLKTTGELFALDRKAAEFVIRHSDDLRALEKNAGLAKKLGKSGGVMLESGGMSVLAAAEKYSPSVVKQALEYGKAGVEHLVREGTGFSLRAKVRSIKMTYNGRMLYHLRNILHMAPWPVTVGGVLYMFLALFKMWFLRPAKRAV